MNRVGCGSSGKSNAHWKSKFVFVLAVCVSAASCKSNWLSQYISPRVEGRVVDSQSHEAIRGVRVHRIQNENRKVMEPRHGAELLANAPVVATTSKDGRFVLDSEMNLAPLIRSFYWHPVNIAFEHSGYAPYTATYSMSNAISTESGEPVVKTGDILLIRIRR
jgi:hypothetical protein